MDLTQRPRRQNDALGDRKSDTAFVKEVKRLARARGFTAHALAGMMGKRQSVIARHLSSASTRKGTAEDYADVLDVPRAYLRLIAVPHMTDDDQNRGIEALRSTFANAAGLLNATRVDELWAVIVVRLRDLAGSPDVAPTECLRQAYLWTLRVEVNGRCNATETLEPIQMLREMVAPLGVDLAPYVALSDDLVLARMYLMLCSSPLPARDVDDVVDGYRAKLQKRGLYRPQMAGRLDEIKRDPRAVLRWNQVEVPG
jgi:hypothetical protein